MKTFSWLKRIFRKKEVVVDLPTPPAKVRRWPVAFGPVQIAPGASVVVEVRPDCRWKGLKLINTGDARKMYITGAFVGKKPQSSHGGKTSVLAFSPAIFDNEVDFDVCEQDTPISLQVENGSDVEQTFSATLFGTVEQTA